MKSKSPLIVGKLYWFYNAKTRKQTDQMKVLKVAKLEALIELPNGKRKIIPNHPQHYVVGQSKQVTIYLKK